MSPEGRKRIIDVTKRQWTELRAAKQSSGQSEGWRTQGGFKALVE